MKSLLQSWFLFPISIDGHFCTTTLVDRTVIWEIPPSVVLRSRGSKLKKSVKMRGRKISTGLYGRSRTTQTKQFEKISVSDTVSYFLHFFKEKCKIFNHLEVKDAIYLFLFNLKVDFFGLKWVILGFVFFRGLKAITNPSVPKKIGTRKLAWMGCGKVHAHFTPISHPKF